jgi:hypothetical protein
MKLFKWINAHWWYFDFENKFSCSSNFHDRNCISVFSADIDPYIYDLDSYIYDIDSYIYYIESSIYDIDLYICDIGSSTCIYDIAISMT